MSGGHHAVRALRIATLCAIVLPVRRLHKFLEGVGVAILQQIARLLPAKDRERRHTPWCAFEVLLAHQKLGEERMRVEAPRLLAVGKDGAKHSARLCLAKKMILVRSL